MFLYVSNKLTDGGTICPRILNLILVWNGAYILNKMTDFNENFQNSTRSWILLSVGKHSKFSKLKVAPPSKKNTKN